MGKYDAAFLAAGGTLPADKNPSQAYSGGSFITCLPLRTQVATGEALAIKALILEDAREPVLHYRSLGASCFQALPMQHVARAVYRASIPGQEEDFEWFVSSGTGSGTLVFPASAGANPEERLYQTVVVSGSPLKLKKEKQ